MEENTKHLEDVCPNCGSADSEPDVQRLSAVLPLSANAHLVPDGNIPVPEREYFECSDERPNQLYGCKYDAAQSERILRRAAERSGNTAGA